MYTDPFFTKGKNRILLSLAKHNGVKLYINETVYEELLRGHKVFLEKEINTVRKSLALINSFLELATKKVVFDADLPLLLDDFSSRYDEIQNTEQMKIIQYDSEVLKQIVKIDMYDDNPFTKNIQSTDDNGTTRNITKKEIRDAIIWYSYQTYIEKNKLENCYFISRNVAEFGDAKAKKSPIEQPYNLHPYINNNNLIAYKNIHGFLVHNDIKVKEIFYEFHSNKLSEDLFENIYEELNEGLVKELVTKLFLKEIISSTQQYLSEFEPEDIHKDYFMGGYVSSTMYDVNNIELNDVDIYGGNIAVAVDLELLMDVEVYLYDPTGDRHDKFKHEATDTMEVQVSIVFLIPVNVDKDLDEVTFSFREYIKGSESEIGNLNVEIINTLNIDHTDMFPEYDESD